MQYFVPAMDFGGPSIGSGILDLYPAVAGYSTRRLRDDATLSMRIKRQSDNAPLDIGFDVAGNLDLAAIATHCGASNGYVLKWYDQVGPYDLIGGTNVEPMIWSAATGQFYDGDRAALSFSAIRTFTNVAYPLSTPLSLFAVANGAGGGYNHFMCGISSQRLYIGNVPDNSYATFFGSGTWHDVSGNTPNTSVAGVRSYMGVVNNGTLATPYLNGAAQGTKTGTMDATTGIDVGHSLNANFWGGKASELLLFNTDQSANALAIQANQAAYFTG